MNDGPFEPRGSFRSPEEPDPYSFRGGLADPDRHIAYAWAGPMVEGRTVLDLGCGSGDGSVTLLDAGAESVTGVDPTPARIAEAERVHGKRCRFQRADPAALDLGGRSFDAVCCFGVIDDAPDAKAVIEGARGVLAEGGLLLLSMREGRDTGELVSGFGNLREFAIGFEATISPLGDGPGPMARPGDEGGPDEAGTAGGRGGTTRLIAASDSELPEGAGRIALSPAMLAAYREALLRWEERARRAEAEGSAKHWELVAAREAQRRLRKRLHVLEHRPLRVLSRVVRGKPAKLGPGPPLRASEQPPDNWE